MLQGVFPEGPSNPQYMFRGVPLGHPPKTQYMFQGFEIYCKFHQIHSTYVFQGVPQHPGRTTMDPKVRPNTSKDFLPVTGKQHPLQFQSLDWISTRQQAPISIQLGFI